MVSVSATLLLEKSVSGRRERQERWSGQETKIGCGLGHGNGQNGTRCWNESVTVSVSENGTESGNGSEGEGKSDGGNENENFDEIDRVNEMCCGHAAGCHDAAMHSERCGASTDEDSCWR